MQPRNTLMLFLLVALAAAALWHFELREGAGGGAESEQQKVFAGVDAKQVEWVELAQGDGSVLRVEKRAEEWRLTQPLDYAADRFHADALASGLADLASDVVYDPAAEDAALHPEPLESYGVTREPRVRFGAAGRAHALRIGDPAPVAGNTYVRAGDEQRVFAVPTWQTNAFSKTLAELREARLVQFDRASVATLTLAWQGGGATLEQKDSAWRVTAPLADAADEASVGSLLSDLETLRADAFLDAPPSDAELGLDAPVYRAELTFSGGAEPLVVVLGGPREGARIAARGASGAVAEIPAASLERLPKTVNALRDKQLAHFEVSAAQRFTLSFAGEGGALSVSGSNQADGWHTEPAMAPGAASALVAELAGLSGADIAADALGEAERAGLGLAPPRAALRVLGAGEGDAAPLLADVRFGIAKAGSGVAAQRADRETIYWLAESIGAQLPLSAAQFRESFAAKEGDAAEAPVVSPPPPPGE